MALYRRFYVKNVPAFFLTRFQRRNWVAEVQDMFFTPQYVPSLNVEEIGSYEPWGKMPRHICCECGDYKLVLNALKPYTYSRTHISVM